MTSPTNAGNHPRLIIADDDPVVRAILSASLAEEFDVVGLAADAKQATELARVGKPDAALVDVDMPKGGGLGAVHGILGVAPGTAIVMLSSDESDEQVRELIAAGAIAYRRKGTGSQELARAPQQPARPQRTARRPPQLPAHPAPPAAAWPVADSPRPSVLAVPLKEPPITVNPHANTAREAAEVRNTWRMPAADGVDEHLTADAGHESRGIPVASHETEVDELDENRSAHPVATGL
jgi:DNA-binding NarL/FixJ family response regulator